MNGFSAAYAKKVVDFVLSGGTYVAPTTTYLGLMSAWTSPATFTEFTLGSYGSGSNYSRLSVANTAWNAPTTPSSIPTITNATAVSTVAPSSGTAAIVAFGLFDAPSGGGLIFGTALASTFNAQSGTPLNFPGGAPGSLVLTLPTTNGISSYLAQKILAHITGQNAYTPPVAAALSMALLKSPYGGSGGYTEATYTSYARAVSTAWSGFTTPSAALPYVVTNTAEVDFPIDTGGAETEMNWATTDATSAGNILFFQTLASGSQIINTGVKAFIAAAYSPGLVSVS